MERKAYRLTKFLLLLCIIIFGYILLRFSKFSEYLGHESLKEIIISYGAWSPVVFIIIYTIRPLFLFPASILTVAGGVIFGPSAGTIYSTLGATFGAMLAFLVSRTLGRDFLLMLFGERLLKMESIIERQGVRVFLILRLIPVIPFDLVNYASGLLKVRFLDYAVGTFSGLLPATFVYTFFGDSLKKAYSIQFFVSIILFVILILLPLIYERKREEKGLPSIMDLKKGRQKK